MLKHLGLRWTVFEQLFGHLDPSGYRESKLLRSLTGTLVAMDLQRSAPALCPKAANVLDPQSVHVAKPAS